MATFASNEMHHAQQQQHHPSSSQYAMAYPPLDLSLNYHHMQHMQQYQGPSSPPAATGQMHFQDPSSPPPSFVGNCDTPCATVASVINHRVFVGSLQIDVKEETLEKVFRLVEPSLTIRDVKIVRESNGASKGYGFVTYETAEDAQKILGKPAGTFTYKGRCWNIGAAVRKFTPHAIPSGYGFPYSPSYYSLPNGTIVGYLPQQIYTSPSPFISSPMMGQSQFVFPPNPPAQQQ